ncbi:hypothetical protein B296_00002380 [Ensete ventricosum]|uniref:Rx N-terminal domain-containing protein n=1 Tax=Ensete ventricosum TaxID=4639 RepID=A0A427AXQ0_ENSVE|nr:hypothetical protein B296_00002380 [Ensete ventricosum]
MVAGIAVASLVASPFIGVVVNKLSAELFEKWGLCRSVRSDARRLQSVLETIQNVLDDAEQQPITNKALRDWLTRLKDAALDADDVVDDLLTEALRRRAQDRSRICRTVRDFLSFKNPMLLRHKMVHRIKDTRARLDEIADERNRFHLAEGSVSHGANERETCSAVVESEVYGRDTDKEKVINFLLDVGNEDLSILPIVGLGGIGKTTLAQLVYNDERVMAQFDGRFWVYVSQNFSIIEIIRSILTGVKRIGTELYGNGGTFPSLVQLEIYDMADMEKWSTSPTDETTDAGMLFPCLKMLTARDCPKLEVEPCFPPSVESLVIENCENLLSARSLQGLSKLRSLNFGGYVASPSAFAGLQNLTALELLRIESCDELTCMPQSLMQHNIPSFQSLKLINNSNLKSLGEGKDQQPPSLFTSLCHLEIEASHSLTALPEWIRYLPLQDLEIRGCSQLEGRCQRETGEDWHKIAHIPCITIEST